jgi:AraC-like DNA-binding protein
MDALIARIAGRYASPDLQTDSLLGRKPLTALLDRMYGPAAVETSVDQLAADAGVSRGYFFRAFRRHVGATPHGLLLRSRLELAKARIQAGHRLADIALGSGFADQSHFSNAFRQAFGLSASAFADWFRR